MIRPMRQEEIPVCVELIRRSFATVAEAFGFTEENAPRFTAFATTEQRLTWHLHGEKRPMFVYENENGVVHVGTKKFEFFPFTCGYMEKIL